MTMQVFNIPNTQPSQYTAQEELNFQKAFHVEQKENLVGRLQNECESAFEAMVEFEQKSQEQNQLLHERITILEKENFSLRAGFQQKELDMQNLINAKDVQIELLQDTIVSLYDSVQRLKQRDWSKETAQPDVSDFTPFTANIYMTRWQERAKHFWNNMPTTEWMKEVLVSIENYKNVVDEMYKQDVHHTTSQPINIKK